MQYGVILGPNYMFSYYVRTDEDMYVSLQEQVIVLQPVRF